MPNIKHFAIALAGIALLSCSESDRQAGRNGRENNAAPEITSAAVYPEQPASNKPLLVHFTSKDPEGDPMHFTFRWHVDNNMVQDGADAVLDPGEYTKGSEVYVEIIPSDDFSEGNVYRTKTVVIINLPPVVESVRIAPADPPVGETLAATPEGTDPDGDTIKYFYRWYVNGKAVTDFSEDNTFQTAGLRKKDMIFAAVKVSDWEVEGTPVDSDIVVLANSAPRIMSSPPENLDSVYTYQVSAVDPDKDRILYSLEKAPPGMTISPTGLIRWLPPKQVAGKQEIPVRIKADDGDGGSAYQEYSLFLQMQ